MAPAAAVAECPEGKELDDGVFMSGATSVSSINGRARLKRYLAPSASVQESATATQGIRRFESRKPVKTNAPAARAPQRKPAVPTTVKARITTVSGANFRRKTTLKRARSRSHILRIRFFTFAYFSLEAFGPPGIVPFLGAGVRRSARELVAQLAGLRVGE